MCKKDSRHDLDNNQPVSPSLTGYYIFANQSQCYIKLHKTKVISGVPQDIQSWDPFFLAIRTLMIFYALYVTDVVSLRVCMLMMLYFMVVIKPGACQPAAHLVS